MGSRGPYLGCLVPILNLKSLASAVAKILKGNPKILGISPSPSPHPLFPLGVILWWALANPSCVSYLKSLASAVPELLKGNPQISGSSSSPGPHPLFILVGFDDGTWQTPAACQIWSRWLHLLWKYKGNCIYTQLDGNAYPKVKSTGQNCLP